MGSPLSSFPLTALLLFPLAFSTHLALPANALPSQEEKRGKEVLEEKAQLCVSQAISNCIRLIAGAK